uniref:Chitin synthase export chaperone n=1 Tax=Globodera rostochiensis TaxID=31243 RepID=A0A914HT78_GLORO
MSKWASGRVICGFITCSLLCANWYGGKSCFYEGRVGFASGLNFVIVIINIVLFFLNFLTVPTVYRMERIYSLFGTILFFSAFVCMVLYVIDYAYHREQLIAATVFIGIQMVLFIWDYQILHGEAYN